MRDARVAGLLARPNDHPHGWCSNRLRVTFDHVRRSSHDELANSDGTTTPQRVEPVDYFRDLRLELDYLEATKTIFRLEHPGEPVPEPKWPLIGDFEARQWLGSGGFGAVIIGRDPELKRLVAIKLCPAVGPDAEGRIRQEAELLARFSHQNIVTIFAFGRHGEDFFYVMEYFRGGDVDVMLQKQDPTRAELVETYCRAGEGLAAAHEHDPPIIHGDFKPRNVLVSEDSERVCVADFGLARALDQTDESERSGGSSSYRMGTVAYMAPELLRGGKPTEMSDQWAFCVSVWESLLGAPYPRTNDPEEMLELVEHGPDIPKLRPGPTADVVKALMRGLSIDPRDRYPNMRALILALRAAMAIVPSTRRRRRVYPAAVAISFAVGLVALALSRGDSDHRSSSEDSPQLSELPPQLSEPTAPTSPCAMFDPGEQVPELVQVKEDVLAVCELIRAGHFKQAETLWDKTDRHNYLIQLSPVEESGESDTEASEQNDATEYGEDTLIISRTFIDEAENVVKNSNDENCKNDDCADTVPKPAQQAADYAREWLEIAEIELGSERINAVSERLKPFAH